jgi:hypothetical protein
MPKNKPPKGRFAPEHLPKLWEALERELNSFEKASITRTISAIADQYWASQDQPTVAQAVRLLRQIRDNRARERKLWKQLDSIRPQIATAAHFRKQGAEASYVSLVKDGLFREYRDDLDDGLDERDLDITFLIENPDVLGQLLNRSHHNDYRKRAESALVIEPFLDLLEARRLGRSRAHPRNKMVEALYRVIGIAKPPSQVGIRQIVKARKRKTQR